MTIYRSSKKNTENYEESEIFTKKYTVNVLGKTTISAKNTYYGTPEKAPIIESTEVDIKLELDKKDDTFVPFGIKDFENKEENQFFRFKYTLEKANLDELFFEIISSEGTVIYQVAFMRSVIIKQQQTDKTEKPKEGPLVSKEATIGSPDIEPIDYTLIGNYIFSWDGFDNNGIYDSTLFNGKTLKARVTGKKNGKQKTAEIEFTTAYSQVQWTDVKINAKTKRIDVTLRVNLTDGGAKGLDCKTYNGGNEFSSEGFSSNQPDPFKNVNLKICNWDKIPKSVIDFNKKEPIKTRTRKFADLEKLAIEGLNYHWGRNKNHAVAKDVKINADPYEVYVNAINTKENAMDDVDLVYNTNGKWMRSGNPGTATWNPISWVGNAISREAVCYNVGYIKGTRWRYREATSEDLEFKFTTAHEIGHEILKSYGGTVYSYGHKGSVNVVTQSMKDTAPNYPTSGEIDIMPYYPSDPPLSQYDRYVASEKDVFALIWFTKIELK